MSSIPSLFCFRRKDHEPNLLEAFGKMMEEEALLDCSLVCEGKVLKAHKVLLSACSEYFKTAFTSLLPSCQNTAIIIKDMPFSDLKIIVDFIYRGEIMVEQSRVPSLIRSAEALKVVGLCSKFSAVAPLSATSSSLSSTPSTTPSSSLAALSSLQAALKRPQPSLLPPKPLLSTQSPPTFQLLSTQPLQPLYIQSLQGQIKQMIQPKPTLTSSSSSPLLSSQLLRGPPPPKARDPEPQPEPKGVRKDIYSSSEEVDVEVTKFGSKKAIGNGNQKQDQRRENFVKPSEDGDESEGEQVIDLSGNCGQIKSHLKETKKRPLSTPKSESIACLNQEDTNSNRIEQITTEPTIETMISCIKARDVPKVSHHIPMSVPISMPSTISSATARAIAASVVASGLLGNAKVHSREFKLESDASKGSLQQQPASFKRGRGRPPRHSRESDEGKTYKVRPILPSGSKGSLAAAGIIISSEPTPAKRGRPGGVGGGGGGDGEVESEGKTGSLRGRRPKSATPLRDVDGKNKCPHCPQVYYSTQAMNDHINNVHSRNAQKYICSHCQKEFSWKISLNKHLRKIHSIDPLLADRDSEDGGHSDILYI